jgi:hypothetical protein
MRFVRPRWPRFGYAATSLLLAVIVVAAVAQAGRQYVWCQALQQVIAHSCCAGAASEGASAPAVTITADDCCQARSVPLLDNWTPVTRAADVSAPLVAVLSYEGREVGRQTHSAAPASHDPTMRTGPPQSRVLAQLMVLRI